MSAFNTKQDVSNGEDLELQEQTTKSEDNNQVQYNEDDEDDEDGEDSESHQSGGSSHVAIDLSENEIYKGICTLFEDENGNNILEYISLLHSELIGHNKLMKTIKKDLGRIADCAEIMAKKMK